MTPKSLSGSLRTRASTPRSWDRRSWSSTNLRGSGHSQGQNRVRICHERFVEASVDKSLWPTSGRARSSRHVVVTTDSPRERWYNLNGEWAGVPGCSETLLYTGGRRGYSFCLCAPALGSNLNCVTVLHKTSGIFPNSLEVLAVFTLFETPRGTGRLPWWVSG